MDIDFVITWVDGQDENWLSKKAEYKSDPNSDDGDARYRDWNLLRYLFRGIETFAPWVRKVHFVTWGHVPAWLNVESPKLHIVRHEEIMPAEILPTFNSTAIENYLHKIEGLSEHFVFFNDDMFLLKKIKPDYFFKNGMPCDILALQPVVANPDNTVMPYLYLNNTMLLAKYFNKRALMKKNPGKFFHVGYPFLYFFYNLLEVVFPRFTGFYTVHGPSPFLKATFLEVWEKEEEALKKASANRFRCKEDFSQYLYRTWQMLKGNFVPKNIKKSQGYFEIGKNNEKLLRLIKGQKKKIVCINDTGVDVDIIKTREELLAAFEAILPNKSEFEKE